MNCCVVMRMTCAPRLTTQAQRPGPRDAWIATGARCRRSLRAWLGIIILVLPPINVWQSCQLSDVIRIGVVVLPHRVPYVEREHPWRSTRELGRRCAQVSEDGRNALGPPVCPDCSSGPELLEASDLSAS